MTYLGRREIIFPSSPSILESIKKSLLTASDLKEAVVRVEGVVVELHAAGDRDRHSGIELFDYKSAIYWTALFV